MAGRQIRNFPIPAETTLNHTENGYLHSLLHDYKMAFHLSDKGDSKSLPSNIEQSTYEAADAGLVGSKHADLSLADLPLRDRLKTTLFDLASHSLQRRSLISNEKDDKDSVYQELNRIMTLNGYPKANIAEKHSIKDADLPVAWNSVFSNQEFILYATKPEFETLQGREKLEHQLWRKIVEKTSTLPVEATEGYFQVLKRMHPDWRDEDLSKEAHRIKKINGNRDILIEGEVLATATEKERRKELEKRLKELPQDESSPKDPNDRKGKPESERGKPGGDTTDGDKKNPSENTDEAQKEAPPNKSGKKEQPEKIPTEPQPSLGEKPEIAASLSMLDAYAMLRKQHSEIDSAFVEIRDSQGVIGRTFDSAKNYIGADGENKSWLDPRKLWSQVFDQNLGSEALSDKLAQEDDKLNSLKKAAEAKDEDGFKNIYRKLIGQEFDPKSSTVGNLSSHKHLQEFDGSQKRGVDTSTDIAAALVSVASLRAGGGGVARTLLRASATGAVLGGTSKAGLMQIDGHYADLKRDAAVGALMGATVPLGELAGSQLSRIIGKRVGMTVTGDLLTARIETMGTGFGRRMLSASVKSGTSGAVFGAIESPGREVIHKIERGESVSAGELAELSIKGATIGFAGGTLLGAAADRVVDGFRTLRPGSVRPPGGNGGTQDLSSSTVSLDEAAKLLNKHPQDFAQHAQQNPYGAVEDSVRLYEKTGLNIKKTNALTGEPIVPEKFADALTTVQNVDLLTAESGLNLSKKVNIVKSVDEHLALNSAAVEDPFARVVADRNYQEVLRLKTLEGGQQSAQTFENNFRKSFEKDLKTSTAVERIQRQSISNEEALAITGPKAEIAYKQKAADFFKDMTDPVQRAKLNQLVDDIYVKFNPEVITKNQVTELLESIPSADRDLAVAIMHESAGVSSDTLLKARLQGLRSEIESTVGSASPNNVYTLAPNSSGNLIGYLYRKSNSISMSINNVDQLAQRVANGDVPQSIVIFDDISQTTLGPSEKALLKRIPHVYVVDVGAFEKAINVVDLSRGASEIATKLEGLVEQAKRIRAAEPNLLPTGVARKVLGESVDSAAKSLGDNVKVIRPPETLSVSYEPNNLALTQMSDVDALHARFNIPKSSKEEIASFLSGYTGAERELAASMLADGAVHNSFPAMARKAITLHKQLEESLAKHGMKMSDLVLVPDKDPGGSTHLISYLFGRVNGLSSENFVSAAGLNQMIKSGAAKSKAVAYFDDTIYSGSQTAGMLDSNISSLMPFKRIVIGSLGAYEKGISRINGTHLAGLGKVEVATAASHHPFYSNKHPFFSRLSPNAQHSVKTIGGSDGFGDVQGSLIWSYMYPDNNINFFGSQFSGKVLHLPGP